MKWNKMELLYINYGKVGGGYHGYIKYQDLYIIKPEKNFLITSSSCMWKT